MLFEGNFPTTANSRANYDVTRDGQRFLLIQPSGEETGATQINVVLNWFEELKKRVPSGQ